MALYWVDGDNGDNGNPGTEAEPWATVNYAVGQVSAGDTVYIEKTASAYAVAVTLSGDFSANRVTIRAADIANQPVWDKNWGFDNTKGWNIEHVWWDSWTSGSAVRIGATTQSTDITFSFCSMRHSINKGFLFERCKDILLELCHFRDVRSRVDGTDRSGCIFDTATSENVTFSWCFWEDIGADGIHMRPNSTVVNAIIQDSIFCVNRSATGGYGTDGTSLYNGDTTTWQDVFSSVSEQGVDMKRVLDANEKVQIIRCGFFGFWEVLSPQDAGGATPAGSIEVHRNSYRVTMRDCVIYNCERGSIHYSGVDVECGGTIEGCFYHRNIEYDIYVDDAAKGIAIKNNILIGTPSLGSIYLRDSVVSDLSNNIVESDPVDGTGNTGSPNNNIWLNGTPAAFYQGAGDGVDHKVNIKRIDTRNGDIIIKFDDFEITISSMVLRYHPNKSHLFADIATALLTGTTTTITEEVVGERYSVKLEQ